MSSLHAAVKIAMQKGWIVEGRKTGAASKLARMYGLSRQVVAYWVKEERRRQEGWKEVRDVTAGKTPRTQQDS